MQMDTSAFESKYNQDQDYPVLKANWKDSFSVYLLEKKCFSPDDAWPIFEIVYVLSSPSINKLKIECQERLIAFIAAEQHKSKSISWITTIAVAPTYQRLGLAKKLLNCIENEIDTPAIRLSVRKSNTPAINLYCKSGYQQVDIWPKYYIGGEDGLVFEKKI